MAPIRLSKPAKSLNISILTYKKDENCRNGNVKCDEILQFDLFKNYNVSFKFVPKVKILLKKFVPGVRFLNEKFSGLESAWRGWSS